MPRRVTPEPVTHTDFYGGVPYGSGGAASSDTSWEVLHGLQYIGGEVGEPFDQLPFGTPEPEPDLSATIVVPADHPTNDTGAEIVVEKGTWEGNDEVVDEPFVPPSTLPEPPEEVVEPPDPEEPPDPPVRASRTSKAATA